MFIARSRDHHHLMPAQFNALSVIKKNNKIVRPDVRVYFWLSIMKEKKKEKNDGGTRDQISSSSNWLRILQL